MPVFKTPPKVSLSNDLILATTKETAKRKKQRPQTEENALATGPVPSDQLQIPLLDARLGPLLEVLLKVLPTPGVHHVHGRHRSGEFSNP